MKLTISIEAFQLVAKHFSISSIKQVVTDSAPSIVDADLNSALSSAHLLIVCVVGQSHIAMATIAILSRWICIRIKWAGTYICT